MDVLTTALQGLEVLFLSVFCKIVICDTKTLSGTFSDKCEVQDRGEAKPKREINDGEYCKSSRVKCCLGVERHILFFVTPAFICANQIAKYVRYFKVLGP